MTKRLVPLPEGYEDFLRDLKARIKSAQLRAALSVNRELVLLYWQIGRDILARQKEAGWGAKVIDRLAEDLRTGFPEIQGFSPRNILYMKELAAAYPDPAFAQQVVAQIPWGHNVRILDKVKDPAAREWYLRAAFEHGWSRDVLVMQIESDLRGRKGKSLTNFSRTLPAPQSDLAEQLLKDPYNFEFLTLGEDAKERALHQGLLEHLRDFLLELGVGFAFVGSQYPLEVGGEDFRIDLLFYHLDLHCFIVIELKTTTFKPEYAGKLNFYLSAVDDLVRRSGDNPTIGIILCKAKNKVVVEYALRDTAKPMGVSEFRHTAALPEKLKGQLPTVEDLEKELREGDKKEPR